MYSTQFPFEITQEPILPGERDDVFLEEYPKMYRHVESRNAPNLKKMERFFQRWKEYPETWDLYYTALCKHKDHDRSEEILESMVKLFPEYVSGFCRYALEFALQEEIEKVEECVGTEPALERAFPGRDSFSCSEVLSYYMVFIEMELVKDNYDKAEQYLNLMAGIDGLENNDTIRYYRSIIEDANIDVMEELYDTFRKPKCAKPVAPEGYAHVDFVHPEIEEMFNHVKLLDKSTIDSILALPRQTAIGDLEQILYRVMFEFTEEDHRYDIHYGLSHVLWFLYAFEALESEPIIACLLQEDYLFFSHWFGGSYISAAWPLYFLFLKEDPSGLLEIMRKPNLHVYPKIAILVAIEELVVLYPERKEQIIIWLGDLLTFYAENIDNEDVFDSEMIQNIGETAAKMQAKSLLPQLKMFYEKKYIDYYDFQFIEEEMDDPASSENLRTGPFSIYEMAEGECVFFENSQRQGYFTQPEETLAHTPPAAGRNDPCPCGSGKKHKKCCLK